MIRVLIASRSNSPKVVDLHQKLHQVLCITLLICNSQVRSYFSMIKLYNDPGRNVIKITYFVKLGDASS